MNNFLIKIKGVIFIIAGLLWLVGVFASVQPTANVNANEVFVFIIATVCGFSVMTYGVSWISNTEK